MEDNNHAPIVPVLIHSQRFQPFKERLCTVCNTEGFVLVLFVALCAKQDGSLHSLVVHGRFIITTDLEGWISLYPHSGICIFRIGFFKRMGSHFVVWYPFHFGIILLFWNGLDVTLVRSDVHLLFTNGALTPTRRYDHWIFYPLCDFFFSVLPHRSCNTPSRVSQIKGIFLPRR